MSCRAISGRAGSAAKARIARRPLRIAWRNGQVEEDRKVTYKLFTALLELHKTDPEGVKQLLEDPEFLAAVIRRMKEIRAEKRDLLDAAITETAERNGE